MLDLHAIRSNPEKFRQAYSNRGGRHGSSFEELLRLDDHFRKKAAEIEEIQAKRNSISKQVGLLKTHQAQEDALHELVQEADKIKKELAIISGAKETLEQARRTLLMSLPNLPDSTVPIGISPDENKVVRTFGEVRSFDFTAMDHQELGEKLKILDFQTATTLAGSRFVILRGAGAALERALARFMLDLAIKHGYQEITPPALVLAPILEGTGQLPKFEEDLYKIGRSGNEPDLYLIPTSEVPLVNIHRDQVINEKDLPIAYTSLTACFRREAGSYGKDTRGLIRNHQFQKVELVRFSTPEKSSQDLELLTRHAEEVLKQLELPYRVVELCTGDLGFASSKTYDLEVWMPGENRWREISSCSNCKDFQARRAGIKVLRLDGKKEFLHTLNGSGLALGRALASVLENYQKADGSVAIPRVLQKDRYLSFSQIAD